MESKTIKANISSTRIEDESIESQDWDKTFWPYVAKISSQLEDFKSNLAAQEKKIKRQENEIKRAEKDLRRISLKNTETLGIFVALFTFISVEFQVFRIYQSAQSVSGLTLIILGSLLMFVCFLDYVSNADPFFENGYYFSRSNKDSPFSWFKVKIFPMLIISATLIFFGFLLFVTDDGRLKVREEIITRGYTLSSK